MTKNTQKTTFDGLGIAPELIEVLDKKKFVTPTPIQRQAIPVANEGKDVMGIAQTGTGKTLAFCVPMIQALNRNKGTGLVIVPTRELALQADETFKKIGTQIGIQTTVLIGGAPIGRQIGQLRRNPDIMIATPGRLIDHLERKSVKLEQVKVLVLDEADRMLDMGFAPQIKQVLKYVPKERQTLLFSATMPKEIVGLAREYMKLPVQVEIAPSGTASENVEQELFFIQKHDKSDLLQNILNEYKGPVLVFSRTKYGATKIARNIRSMGHEATEIHSNRSLSQRRSALDGFKKGRYRVLVATDIAARGIDVKGIELVINYDLPATAEDYVHRIGRTGRAGHAGRAISFATPDQKSEVRKIERFIKETLSVSPLPESVGQIKNSYKHADPQRPSTTEQKQTMIHSGEKRSSFGKGSQRPEHRRKRGGRNQRRSPGNQRRHRKKY